MNFIRKDSKDYAIFASIENKHFDDFKLSELSGNNFKCLIFFRGRVSDKNAEISRRVPNKLENKPNISLKKIAEYS